MDAIIEQVLLEVTTSVRQASDESLIQARTLIQDASRIFISGVGRSGLCMRSLGMRLVHLEKTVYIVGETTTPSIVAEDLLILGSGSGQTDSLLLVAQKAQHQGARTLLFTTDETSPLAQLADHCVVISAPSLNRADGERSIQPMGSLFEQSLLIWCDCLILGLMQSMGIDAEQMRERHANLE